MRGKVVLLASVLSVWPLMADAADEPGIAVQAVSVAEGRAVLSVGAQAPAVFQVGEELMEGRYVILKVLEDHVVLEERKEGAQPEQVWIYVVDSKGVSRVQRLARSDERAVRTPAGIPQTGRSGVQPRPHRGARK